MKFRNDLPYIGCEWWPYCKGHFQSFPLRQFQTTSFCYSGYIEDTKSAEFVLLLFFCNQLGFSIYFPQISWTIMNEIINETTFSSIKNNRSTSSHCVRVCWLRSSQMLTGPVFQQEVGQSQTDQQSPLVTAPNYYFTITKTPRLQ